MNRLDIPRCNVCNVVPSVSNGIVGFITFDEHSAVIEFDISELVDDGHLACQCYRPTLTDEQVVTLTNLMQRAVDTATVPTVPVPLGRLA